MPETTKSIVDFIKTKIIGTDMSADAQIDKVLDRITDVTNSKNNLNYAEMLRKYFSDSFRSSPLLNKGVIENQLQTYIVAERNERYSNSEEIVDSIPYFARALKVLADEIVSPDDISKKVISIIQEETDSTHAKTTLHNVEKIVDVLEINDYIQGIIYETLKLGDQFVEICNFKENDIPITQTILKESDDELEEDSYYLHENLHEFDITWEQPPADVLNEMNIPDADQIKYKLKLDIIHESDTKDNVDISDVRLIIHDPRYVIKLQSNRFKMCLGYLILPRFSFASGMHTRSSNINALSDYRDLMGIDKLYSELVKRVQTQIVKKELDINKKEVMGMLSRVVKEIDDIHKNNFQVRYVPAEKMEHLYMNNKRFFPYGESIFYKSTFTAKLLIALETAVIIKRISDSVDTRAFYIETGTPRDVRTVLDQVREARTKRKVSIDKFGSIGSIPSMITSYEDYYIPQTNGKRFIEFESIPPTNSIRDITEELKFFRDMAIASLDVPPALINMEENVNARATLTQETLLFARTIVAYQSHLSTHVNRLIEKIYRYVYKENYPKNITVSFAPPKFLQLEKDLEYNRLVSEMINTLSELGIDKEYLKKKYLNFDWNKLKEFENQQKLENKAKLTPNAEDELGAMGSSGLGL